MPGCGVLVTASKMGIHLKHECIEAKNRRVLADKGKSAEGETACNACGASMPRNCLRKHLAHNCDMRLVSCSRPGCNVSVTAKSLADHQRIDCTAARRNAAFVEEAARKPKMENCPDCQTTIVSNLFRAHLAEECSRRIVICPNKKLGCDKDMHASEVESHVREDCVVQLDRDERASHHDSRLGRVRCSGCGYTVVVRHLANHQQHKCPNRRVPCKHWELGCRAMLRLSTMDEHTKVDRLLEPRACLAFDGGKAYIALGEEDIKPPWTVEMWIWRPGLVEGTREKTRTALKAYWGFQRARDRLAVAERRLAMLEPLLVAAATSSAKIPSKESKEEREKLTDEMVDAATVRDDAKLELVVSSVVLNKNLAAAIRGVEEITAQDRLCNFDRLALGSTPWYAIPTDAVSNIIENARGGHRDLTKCGRSKKALTNLQRSPPSNPLDPQGSSNRTVKMPNSDAKSATGETSIGISEGADAGPRGFKANAGTSQAHHDYFHVRESNESDKRTHDVGQAAKVGHDVSPKDVVATIRTGESLQVDGIPAGVREENMEEVRGKDEAPTVAEVVNFPAAPQEAVEISLAQREASYWAEWVALNGTSLARKILYLASETLPRLKVEIVNITGLAVEVLFGDSSDAASDVVGTTPVGDDSSSRSNQRSGKSAARKAARKARRKEKHEQQFGKKLETRMAEEVRKRAGVESLFGSDKVLFQLEMGPQDRVGIKLAGKPDKIFNYRCPRERWVHLSFVSDSSGVLLLENGKTASRLPDVSVPLPMREIGGRDMACQCLLQEVRYWRVKRSKEELTAWMHEVLPSTSVANGLVAYWTFEEGAGEHVNDVTQQRFRAMRVGRGLEWVTPALMCLCKVGEAPTPSWREQNVCKVSVDVLNPLAIGYAHCVDELLRVLVPLNERRHHNMPSSAALMYIIAWDSALLSNRAPCTFIVVQVELRRARLVQRGRLHQQYVSCPAGCGETFLRKNARAHTAYRCKMRMVTCSMATCGKSVMVRDLTRCASR